MSGYQMQNKKSPQLIIVVILLTLLSVSVTQFSGGRASAQDKGHVEIKISNQVFDAFVGQYQLESETDFIFSFLREGDKYYVQASGQSRIEIFAESPSRFFLRVIDAQVDFVRDSNGRVTSIIWHQGGNELTAKRISDQPAQATGIEFVREEVMIPMRDGIRLHTVILKPKHQTDALPIIIERTPYGVEGHNSENLNFSEKELVEDGYIFAYQDIRGKYGSEGEFVMVRPSRNKGDAKSIDESTDVYDTIDWLVKNVPRNNGRVGIKGGSYDGWLATMALIDPHPALKADSPQAPVADFWMGDDFFHNGAFRQSYGHEYVKAMETSKSMEPVSFGKVDSYDWYLDIRTLANLTAQLGNKLPTWNAFVEHPAYDSYWKARAVKNNINRTRVPTLVVGGWWDQEDLYGALTTYQILKKHDARNLVSLVEGPWNHGGWYGNGKRLSEVNFGSETGKYFRKEIQAPWFAYYLKNKGARRRAGAMIFQSGTNKWMRYESWPPQRKVQRRELYLAANHKLTFSPPPANNAATSDSYVSDPAAPVPYRKRPVEATYDPNGSGWYTWLAQDQKFLGDRSDVISWQTEPLARDTTVSGDIIAHLFASTTGTDSDWVVKLIDVYPSSGANEKTPGYQLIVASEIFRGRYLKSFEKPAPIQANLVNRYAIDLHGNDHCFLKGHRIMVQIQSSWFPLYDRNPQKFVENIFLAKEDDFRPATQRIYRSARYPSHVTVSLATTR